MAKIFFLGIDDIEHFSFASLTGKRRQQLRMHRALAVIRNQDAVAMPQRDRE